MPSETICGSKAGLGASRKETQSGQLAFKRRLQVLRTNPMPPTAAIINAGTMTRATRIRMANFRTKSVAVQARHQANVQAIRNNVASRILCCSAEVEYEHVLADVRGSCCQAVGLAVDAYMVAASLVSTCRRRPDEPRDGRITRHRSSDSRATSNTSLLGLARVSRAFLG